VTYRSEVPRERLKKEHLQHWSVLSVDPVSGWLTQVSRTTTEYKEGISQIPAAALTTEDTDLIADLSLRGEVAIHLVLTPRDLPLDKSYKVIADLKGSQLPNQVVIVSAHIDSWDLGTGALDDASGLGVAMDVMRIINTVNPQPKRTIQFVAWINEENGGRAGICRGAPKRTTGSCGRCRTRLRRRASTRS